MEYLIRLNNSHNHYNSILKSSRINEKKYGGYELTTEGIKIYKELKELKNYMLKNENKYKLVFKIKDKEINLNRFSSLLKE